MTAHAQLAALSQQAHQLAAASDEAGLTAVEAQVNEVVRELWGITGRIAGDAVVIGGVGENGSEHSLSDEDARLQLPYTSLLICLQFEGIIGKKGEEYQERYTSYVG